MTQSGPRRRYCRHNPLTYDGDSAVKTVGGGNVFGLTYNANGDRIGETINGQPTTFTYDFDDRLTSITTASGTISYRYDAIGRQVSKTVNGTLTGYYLDGNTILIEKTNGVNTAQYTWGDGLIRCNGEYPMEDGRGNVRFTTNASKTITSANSPNAFGVGSVTASTASAFSWNAKSGYRQDGVSPTGLSSAYSFQKVGERYYDPTLMCFLTRDTELDQLPYTYCGGDPVNRVDPSGHSFLGSIFNGIVKAIVGIVKTVTSFVIQTVAQQIKFIAENQFENAIFITLVPFVAPLAFAVFGPSIAAVVATGVVGGAVSGYVTAELSGENALQNAGAGALFYGLAEYQGITHQPIPKR